MNYPLLCLSVNTVRSDRQACWQRGLAQVDAAVDGHLADGSEGRSDARAALAYSAIGIWLLFDFGRQFNKPPDRFSTRWEVALGPAPVVYHAQKLLGYPHLK
jgi:hypothetical protein